MKTRFLLYVSLSATLLVFGWACFIFAPLEPVSDLALDLMEDYLRIAHFLPSNVTAGSPIPGLTSSDLITTASDTAAKAPPWEPYRNTSYDLFQNVYVISLPHRTDRRISMERLREALAVNWTYVDATGADSTITSRIFSCVRTVRTEQALNSTATRDFVWPKTFDVLSNTMEPSLPGCFHLEGSHSSTTSDIHAPQDFSPELTPLTCATGASTDGPSFDPSLPPHMLLTPAKVACWYSHLQVLKQFAYAGVRGRHDDKSAMLILEDDVNMERDTQEQLQRLSRYLPESWDALFLGHCWSDESESPPLVTLNETSSGSHSRSISLHKSHAPKCTHAYAVTRPGALKLVQYLQYPPFAYSRALDQAFAWLIMSGRMESYSVVPSLVVQRKVSRSDVDPGATGFGSEWRDSLVNGILPE